MEITVEIKNVYGIEKIYPLCEKGKLFAQLSGCKTLTPYAIQVIKKLGYAIKVQPATTLTL